MAAKPGPTDEVAAAARFLASPLRIKIARIVRAPGAFVFTD